jgi:hypothetical protein
MRARFVTLVVWFIAVFLYRNGQAKTMPMAGPVTAPAIAPIARSESSFAPLGQVERRTTVGQSAREELRSVAELLPRRIGKRAGAGIRRVVGQGDKLLWMAHF